MAFVDWTFTTMQHVIDVGQHDANRVLAVVQREDSRLEGSVKPILLHDSGARASTKSPCPNLSS